MNYSKFDIVIVGGGMVGLAMAAALADSTFKVAVVEKNDFESIAAEKLLSNLPVSSQAFDLRVSAISPANQELLTALNCWQNIPESRLADYQSMHVWDGDGTGKITFNAAEIAAPKLGTIVENQVLRAAIYQQLANKSNVTLIENAEINFISTSQQQVEISLTNSHLLVAKLLIGADGAFSQVREKLDIAISEMPYRQTAFVANVAVEKTHQNIAWQRFTPTGPIAFLPLPEPNLCSIVWSIDDNHNCDNNNSSNHLKQLTPQEFADKLASQFEFKLGRVTAVSEFRGFPLIKRHAQSYLRDRCALIGDAAHTIHPLAGQGVNLGFQDVACLSQLLIDLHDKGRDIGLKANLRIFERERKAENSLMQEAMSGFKWLFGQQNMPITLLRNFSLSAVDRSNLLKQVITRRAMGF
ncbi:UbiH/UbiF/VisC/COQ6 family ubiquinone biosynthesis hydroxylase [Aliikangiella coralliicola]|uniref:FAD-dependent oxidoreductase n=1 Tax=Aliikangiella coralliicola TaxID=2592383 RepID=A0A545UI88_9GAMM|nr:UbiH/UbiF/VisC/COQ6 family ubiquinone biosynthesis hydroxylase [Aliikangiella coralliicola]TQV89184.1 FAD-dependent oxidoreductase [Aliikangiella coralliicola]